MGLVLLVAVVGFVIAQLEEIVVPFMIALLLLTAFLNALVSWLVRHGWPKWVAVLRSVMAAASAIAGIVMLVGSQISSGLPNVEERARQAFT